MPATKRPKPLYQRGKYALYRRAGRENLEIVWYDDERKRERSASAGTADVGQGRLALDKRYLGDAGSRICPACGQAIEHEGSPLLMTAIADYLILSQDKAGLKSAKTRLRLVTDYLLDTSADTTCAAADERWINGFRKWMAERPGKSYSLSHIEGCVMQIAAVINATPGEKAEFRAAQMKEVANSPVYRADVETIAAMFNFCLRPTTGRTDKERAMIVATRAGLLAYLRAAVATWARPDAIYDIHSRQWHSAPRVLHLNPPGRRQTRKYRPSIPIARQFAPFLDDLEGNLIQVTTIRHAWDSMKKALGLPAGREAGEKLIRRSMATLVRKRIGEERWAQGEMMLGHVKASISDIYAIPDPANLGLALAATEQIIDEIESLAPGAYRIVTAQEPKLSLVNGGKNG